MTHKKFNLLIAALCFFGVLKAQPPAWVTAEAAPDYYFKPNMGQLHDRNGTLITDGQLYTGTQISGTFFLEMGRVAHTQLNTVTKWSCRIDIKAVCGEEEEVCGNFYAFDLTDEKTNYYDEYLPDGIVDVENYKGAIHEGAYPNIDIIYTSNRGGVVTIYQIKPGGDPADIALGFEGQGGININDDYGYIELTTSDEPFILNRLEAFQIEDASGELVSLGWKPDWSLNSDNLAILSNLGAYDVSRELYLIDKPIGGNTDYTQDITGIKWSTRYGDGEHLDRLKTQKAFSHEKGGTIRIDQATGDIYHTMSRPKDNLFPPQSGCEQLQNAGGYDIFITKFDGDTYERKWCTYYGGAADDICNKMAISSSVGSDLVYLTGYTMGTLPNPSGGNPNNGTFIQAANNGGKEAFISSYGKSDGILQWVTHFGGAGDDEATSITIDDIDHKLYIVGNSRYSSTSMPATTINCVGSSGTGFPVCAGSGTGGRYIQSSYTSTAFAAGVDCFIAEFDIDQNNNALDWSTLFGSNKADYVYDVLKVNNNGEKALYICGTTKGENSTTSYPASTPLTSPIVAGDFPFADPGTTNRYFQYTNLTSGDDEAFIAKFDADSKLTWSTHFGGNGSERFTSLATNKDDNSVFAVGLTTTVCQATPGYNLAVNDVWWPTYAPSGVAFMQPQLNSKSTTSGIDVMLTRFSNTGELTWSTYFGGSYPEIYEGSGGDAEYNVYAQMEDGVGANNLYIYGTTTWYSSFPNNPDPTPTHQVNIPNYVYNQADNMSALVGNSENSLTIASDVFLAAFNHHLIFAYGTHFGGWSGSGGDPVINGQADEIARDFDIRKQDHGIFLTGGSACIATPEKYPGGSAYFQQFSPPSGSSYSNLNTTPGDWNLFITHLQGDSWWASTGGARISLDDQNDKEGRVSPNPLAQNSAIFTVSLEAEMEQPAKVIVYDFLGREHYKGDYLLNKGENKLPVDLSQKNIGKGIYTVKIEGNNLNKSIVLIVE